MVASPAPAAAQPAASESGAGPLLMIERISVEGNTKTSSHLIERVIGVEAGDVMRAGDPRLVSAEFNVLAMGFFREVAVRLEKGSQRDRVVLVIAVKERGTIILERLFFGTTQVTPWWAGLDVTERNFAGTGFAVGGGFVVAGEGDAEGADSQRAFQLRITDTSLLGTRVGWFAAAHYLDASEPFRVRGDPSDGAAENFAAFDYSRTGAQGGVNLAVSGLSTLTLGLRAERVEAVLPDAPTRELEDGTVRAVNLGLLPGGSRVVTGSIAFDRDTRNDPVLTGTGDRLQLRGELGASWLGGQYDYGTAFARYQRWWEVGSPSHVMSVHLTGGVVIADAPRFDQLHVGDLNRMVSPRAMGLVVSSTPSLDLLGTATEDVTYGEVGGLAEVQYSYRLFRDRFKLYGGDVFFGVGLWSLAQTRDLRVRDESIYRALPIDLLVDIGLRLDTEIGIFELSLANALGRVPL